MAWIPKIQWLTCPSCGDNYHGILRLWEREAGESLRCADDGMPAGPYAWTCIVEKCGDVVTLRAAMTAPPPGSLTTLREFGATFATTMRWEREWRGKVHERTYPLKAL